MKLIMVIHTFSLLIFLSVEWTLKLWSRNLFVERLGSFEYGIIFFEPTALRNILWSLSYLCCAWSIPISYQFIIISFAFLKICWSYFQIWRSWSQTVLRRISWRNLLCLCKSWCRFVDDLLRHQNTATNNRIISPIIRHVRSYLRPHSLSSG